MKNDHSPLRPRHHQEHAPTVIHHPEEDETVLARWFRQAYAKGPKFWALAGGALLAAAAVALIVGGLRGGQAAEATDWKQLMLARDPAQQIEIGEHAVSPVAGWALLQAAEARYQEAVRELPRNRDAALPLLKQAHDLFERASRKAPSDSPLGSLAALGMARALEARGDVDGAIGQYRTVAKTWPNTPSGRRAAHLAEQLERPESRQFYEQFAAFKPTEVRLPPGGRSTLGLPPDRPPLTAPTATAPALPGLPPALEQESPPPAPTAMPAPATPKAEPLPTHLDAPTPPIRPRPSAPAEAPRTAAPAPSPDLPARPSAGGESQGRP